MIYMPEYLYHLCMIMPKERTMPSCMYLTKHNNKFIVSSMTCHFKVDTFLWQFY